MAMIVGTAKDDTLTGSAGADNIDGLDGNDSIDGRAGDDTINGGAGNDTLNGGTGDDRLTGGTGNDTYIVDSLLDRVIEGSAAGGHDVVRSFIGYTLGTNLEDLWLLGGGDLTGTGNGLANMIFGTTGANLLKGGGGNDHLSGMRGQDQLYGGSGNDVLDGGANADRMQGGDGDDTYYVDNSGDLTLEASSDTGTDLVISTVSYRMRSGIENVTLAGTRAISAIGNDLANVMKSNDAGDSLSGGGGNDRLIGGIGDDTLQGGAGNDWLEGGKGSDTASYTQSASAVTIDLRISGPQATGDGSDSLSGIENVRGSAFDDHLTGNNDANTILGGDGDDVLTGGAGSDHLVGGKGDDTLFGGEGLNLMEGGDGDDTLSDPGPNGTLHGDAGNDELYGGRSNKVYGDEGNDVLHGGSYTSSFYGGVGDDHFLTSYVEAVVGIAFDTRPEYFDGGDGTDTIEIGDQTSVDLAAGTVVMTGDGENDDYVTVANVENVVGSAFDDAILGSSGANALSSSGGNDNLDGRLGNDVLVGGEGADGFTFSTALDAAANVDAIGDFSSADDTIFLSETIFSAIATGTLDSSAFVIGASAADADDRIVYDPTTGSIYYDSDGSGDAAAVLFATVTVGTILVNADFVIPG